MNVSAREGRPAASTVGRLRLRHRRPRLGVRLARSDHTFAFGTSAATCMSGSTTAGRRGCAADSEEDAAARPPQDADLIARSSRLPLLYLIDLMPVARLGRLSLRSGIRSGSVSHMTCIRFVAAVSMVAVLAPGGFAYAQRPTESAPASSPAIVPFKIHVQDRVLTDVKRRLAQSRFADEFPDAGWDYGTNLAYLKSLVGYWRDKYDWRAQEKRLNAFDQFKTNIDGVDIHFIHQKSKNPNAMPLLLLNGWPSSIIGNAKSDWRAHRSGCVRWTRRR